MSPDTIAVLILASAALGFCCWIYYSTVLPSIRFSLRLDLFRLRDELRGLVIDGKISEDDPAFGILDTDLSSMVASVSTFDMMSLLTGPVVDSEEVRKAAQKRHEIICLHDLDQVKLIDQSAMRTLGKALAVNSIVMLFVLAPILLLTTVVMSGVKGIRARFFDSMTRVTLAGEDSSLGRLKAA